LEGNPTFHDEIVLIVAQIVDLGYEALQRLVGFGVLRERVFDLHIVQVFVEHLVDVLKQVRHFEELKRLLYPRAIKGVLAVVGERLQKMEQVQK
jgi:hypothetical protein